MMSLLGMNDNNIQLIEDRFNTSITVRGQNVILKGVLQKLIQLKELLKKWFTFLIEQNVKSSDVETILDLATQGKEIINEKNMMQLFYIRKMM